MALEARGAAGPIATAPEIGGAKDGTAMTMTETITADRERRVFLPRIRGQLVLIICRSFSGINAI
ncbi:hypothetical protein ACOZ38_13490 [Sphaerisporangium viridialbum]|uniref:hypothetical protein n=1 Tax=Sphaerisporangium viridialbum TaxID=46189 RepID=UPI003C721236